MSQPIISVHSIGKRYKLGATHGGRGYKTMRDAMARVIQAPLRLFSKNTNKPTKLIVENNYFWALKDISFDVQQGEVLGIIGRNGAGKSTMLKILSQITDPTEGEVRIRGRVASLLEVGTGFHPELTGRENVYLNGAILGMHRAEIKRKFDEIVEFAGVEEFLDTPVKRFSSGMYVRLAFAVAAHLEPEILIVDEVLAVGDAEFQKKCLGKMQAVSSEGRTVIFVSHNMAAIESLCEKVILLEKGKTNFSGPTKEGISFYLKNVSASASMIPLPDRKDRMGNGKVRFVDFKVINDKGEYVNELLSGNDYTFELQYHNFTNEVIKNVKVCIEIFDEKERRMLFLRNDFSNDVINIDDKNGLIRCKISDLPLTIGTYHFVLYLSIHDHETFDLIGNVNYIDVVGGDFFGTGSMGMPAQCKILTKARWS
jgi:lipopolysaccharide transport system ATP-binding protein